MFQMHFAKLALQPLFCLVALVMAPLAFAAAPALGQDRDGGPVLLTVSDASGVSATFTRTRLMGIPQKTIRTTTAWDDGVQEFTGPLARDVLNLAGVEGEMVSAIALNDYAVEIPVADFHAYNVILALAQNGREMSVRDKGPIWIIYPRDDHGELMSAEQNAKWIWQLDRMALDVSDQ